MRLISRPLCAAITFLLLFLLQSCSKGTLPACPGEDAGMRADGALPEPQVRTVSDPTSGGALQGKPAGRDRPKKMILLLDYSGSMYGGYGKDQVASCDHCAAGLVAGRPSRFTAGRTQPYYVATPEFQEFLARWLHAATPEASDLGLEILLFNGRVFRLGENGVEPFAQGTELRFERRVSRASTAEIASWLRQIPGNPFDVDRQAPGTTDSRAALQTALAAVAKDEAILWLITDNIVDTEGGALTDPDARLTTEFYRELDAEPRVQMIAAYPIFQAEPCSWMCSTSLFTYGMYVSHFERPESAEFHRLGGTTPEGGGPTADGLLWNSALQKLAAEYSGRATKVGRGDLAGVPVRLKPIDTEVLAIGFGHPALRCKRAEFGQELQCQARIEVRNSLRHQTVESAKLHLSNEVLLPRKERSSRRLPWASAVCAGQVETLAWQVQGGRRGAGADPIEIGPLAPLQKVAVDVRFKLPPVGVDTSRRSTLFDVALTNSIVLDGLLRAEIHDFHTSLAIDPQSFANVYGSAQLPAIFRKGEVGSAVASYRIDALLANDGQALALLVLLGGGSLAALSALVAMRFQRKLFTVVVDGVESTRLSMPRWSSRELEIGGSVRASLRRGWGSDYRIVPKRGVRLRRDGTAWALRIGDDIGEEHRIEIRRGWSPAKPSSLLGSHMDNW
jgi:hypothetical protein